MSRIDLLPMSRATIPAHSTSSGKSSPQVTINNALAVFLGLIVAIAPLPLGSNRPIAWTVWAVLIGLSAIVYASRLATIGQPFRFGLDKLRRETVMALIVGTYLVIQIIPFGHFTMILVGGAARATPQISVAPGATMLMLLRFVSYCVFFFLMLQVSMNARRRSQLLNALLIITIGYALYGLASLYQFGDTILGLPKWSYHGSATGPFVNRNSYATFLAFGAAIAAAQLASRLTSAHKDRSPRLRNSLILVLLLALAVLLATTLLTNSRMGTLVWISACVTPLLCLVGKTRMRASLVFIIVPATLVAFIGFAVLYGASLVERFGSVSSSALVRLDLYQQTLQLIAQRPLLGFGGGSFEWAFPLVHLPAVAPQLRWDHAHNTYLALWSELGLPVGTLVIVLIGLIAGRVTKAMAKGIGSWTAQAACLGVICAGGLHSLVDFSLEIQANTFLFLAICATGLAASLAGRRA